LIDILVICLGFVWEAFLNDTSRNEQRVNVDFRTAQGTWEKEVPEEATATATKLRKHALTGALSELEDGMIPGAD
jgi:hypothetical protein